MEVWEPKFIRRNWFVLCWSAKWLGEDKVYHSSLPDFRGFKKLPSKTDGVIDKKVMSGLWDLLDQCDVAVAHNLKSFDKKKANARFIIHGRKPPSPYLEVDTLTSARSIFKFTSNKLGYLAKILKVDNKLDPGGFDTWLGCEEGHKKSWNRMVKYCDQDVRTLEKVYLKLRPYIKNHPNIAINVGKCTRCGHSQLNNRGFAYTQTGSFQKYQCDSCGGWGRYRVNEAPKDKRFGSNKPTTRQYGVSL